MLAKVLRRQEAVQMTYEFSLNGQVELETPSGESFEWRGKEWMLYPGVGKIVGSWRISSCCDRCVDGKVIHAEVVWVKIKSPNIPE